MMFIYILLGILIIVVFILVCFFIGRKEGLIKRHFKVEVKDAILLLAQIFIAMIMLFSVFLAFKATNASHETSKTFRKEVAFSHRPIVNIYKDIRGEGNEIWVREKKEETDLKKYVCFSPFIFMSNTGKGPAYLESVGVVLIYKKKTILGRIYKEYENFEMESLIDLGEYRHYTSSYLGFPVEALHNSSIRWSDKEKKLYCPVEDINSRSDIILAEKVIYSNFLGERFTKYGVLGLENSFFTDEVDDKYKNEYLNEEKCWSWWDYLYFESASEIITIAKAILDKEFPEN